MAIPLLQVSAWRALHPSVLVGAAGGALLPLMLISLEGGWGLLAFSVLWQGAYAGSLARLLRPTPVTA